MQPTTNAENRVVKTSGALHRKEARFSRIRCLANATSIPYALYVKARGIWRPCASFSSSIGSSGRDRTRYLKFRHSQRTEAMTVAATPGTQQTICRY
jgi:hypothetical protein